MIRNERTKEGAQGPRIIPIHIIVLSCSISLLVGKQQYNRALEQTGLWNKGTF